MPGKSDMSATLATQIQHECDTSDTSATRVRHEQHECYMNETSATGAKNFDFDNDTGKNIFSHTYIYYMASKRLQGEEQFHTKNYLLEMSRFHAKSAPQKLNFLMAKAISKSCTLDCSYKCPCTFPHSYAQ